MAEKTNKIGRPKLPKSKVKTLIAVRVMPAERALYERIAKRSGMTLSEWIRERLKSEKES